MDLLEKMSTIGSILSSNFANMTNEETQRYKKFLESELRKLDENKTTKNGKAIKIE
jgi:hypothetical protein